MAEKLRGIVPALVTPLGSTGEPDEGSVRRLVRYTLDGGCSGLFVAGSTGEGPMLQDEQWEAVVRWVVDENGGRAKVLASVADSGTARVIRRAHRAAQLGADAVVTTLPYYFVHAGEETLRFWEAVGDNSPLPVYMYNVPQRTQVAMTREQIMAAARHPNIIGVKDSSCDMILHFDLIHEAGKLENGFTVLNGSEFSLGASVMMGGDGGLLGIANVAPGLCTALYSAAVAADIAEVRRLQPMVAEVTSLFWLPECSAVSGVKRALQLLGICEAHVAHPFIPAPEKHDAKIRDILKRNGVTAG